MRFNYFYDSKHVSDTVALKLPDRKCKGHMNFVWERIKDTVEPPYFEVPREMEKSSK